MPQVYFKAHQQGELVEQSDWSSTFVIAFCSTICLSGRVKTRVPRIMNVNSVNAVLGRSVGISKLWYASNCPSTWPWEINIRVTSYNAYHPLSRANGRAMGCILWWSWKNSCCHSNSVVWFHFNTVHIDSYIYIYKAHYNTTITFWWQVLNII